MSELEFLTVVRDGNKVLATYLEDGEKRFGEFPLESAVFINGSGEFRSNYGDQLAVVNVDGSRWRDVIDSYQNKGIELFGSPNPMHEFMFRTFGYHAGSSDRWKFMTFDIEIEMRRGDPFPSTDEAEYPINAISIVFEGRKFLLMWYEDEPDLGDMDVKVIRFDTEAGMLAGFFVVLGKLSPDVVGGWNTNGFDWPYIFSRVKKLFGDNWETVVSQSSPFGRVIKRKNGEIVIPGIVLLDWMAAYKKLVVQSRPSYALDAIASIELGVGKLEPPEGLFGWELWRFEEHYDDFFRYSIIDSVRADDVMRKTGLFNLISEVSHFAHSPIEDIIYTSRVWLSLIYSFMRSRNTIPPWPPEKDKEESGKVVGGFVKDPEVGLFEWVVSFDLTSLYPSIMRSLNVSFDTFVGMDIPSNEVCMASNGACFTRACEGIMPFILGELFEMRKAAKDGMLQARKDGDKEKASLLKIRQMALKVLLNSAYGCLAGSFFPYFNKDVAEAITVTGQEIVKRMGKAIDEFLESQGVSSHVIYSDTDSCYVEMKDVVENMAEGDIVDWLDDYCNEVIQPVIRKAFEDMAGEMNAMRNLFDAKREIIASSGFFVAKKRYALLVHDDEGVRNDPPKVKATGLEARKMSHAPLAREYLKKVYEALLKGEAVKDIAEEAYERFMQAEPPEIANTVYVNSLKTSSANGASALAFNRLVDEGVIVGYPKIQEGDKIQWCYCRNNDWGLSKIAWPASTNPEIIKDFIDRDQQYDVLFFRPLTNTASVCGVEVSYGDEVGDFF